MSVVVLRVSVDTLEVSLHGELSVEVVGELDVLKSQAQREECPQRFRDTKLFVEPRAFGRWRWRLSCPDFSVVAALPASVHAGNRANAQIRLSAYGLSTRGQSELLSEALDAVKVFGKYRERNVARLDVCADVQGWTPTYEEMQGMVCPAVYRGIHLAGARPQTFQYGKGPLALRVYDKTAELAHSGKGWMALVWHGCEGYDEILPVTRIETQMRSGPLGEIGIGTGAQALAQAGSAFEWALREWCQLRVPAGDKKVTRWADHPVWLQLRSSALSDRPCERARRKANLMAFEDAAKRLIGLAALAGAHYGGCDYIKAVQLLSDAAEARMLSDHVDFAEEVGKKRKRLEAERVADVPF